VTASEPCWIVRRSGETDESANERHYSEKDARDEAQRRIADGETATVEQLPEPCITLTCRGCDYAVDEDDEGIIHFESHKQAREYVLGAGEGGVVFDGDVLVRCCYDCPAEQNGGRS
jgi:hypothetical protein